MPADYYVQVRGSTSVPVSVQAGETAELMLGAISVLGLEREAVAVDLHEAASRKRLACWGYNVPVELVPGRPYVKVNQSTSDSVALGSGAREELLLGAIEVDDDFEIWDAGGTRPGYYSDLLLLVPGTYTVAPFGGATIDNVVVRAGQVTRVP